MRIRLFAFIEQSENSSPSRHFYGLPPELTDGQDNRQRLPNPGILTIEETGEGIFLTRIGIDGSFGGDTWHISIEEAKQQAVYEYGALLSEWKQVPSDITDIVAFALSQKP